MKLKTPILVDGKEVKEISLTEPTFDDVAELGLPEDTSSQKEKIAVLKKYVARCSGLPEASVGQIKVSDAVKLLGMVADFFITQE